MPHSIQVQARDLKTGDRCIGPAFFTEQGTVKDTLVNHHHVQVNWLGGTRTIRNDTYCFNVLVPRRPRA